jgi:hypothetical protein
VKHESVRSDLHVSSDLAGEAVGESPGRPIDQAEVDRLADAEIAHLTTDAVDFHDRSLHTANSKGGRSRIVPPSRPR